MSEYKRLDSSGLNYLVTKLGAKINAKAEIVSLTQAEYDALTPAEKQKPNVIYEITDAAGAGTNGHIIVDAAGNDMTPQDKLQFVGATVTNDATNHKTVVTVTPPTVPTALSGFTNDVGFITNAADNLTNYYDKSTVDGMIPTVPTALSDLSNDTGFITNTVNNLQNYYLKTESYTKTEIDTLISSAKTGRFLYVNTLPTVDIDTSAIYLVPKSISATNNVKEEYINLDGTTSGWEKIGDTEIDLSGYVTTSALNTTLADYVTNTALTTALSSKSNISAVISVTLTSSGWSNNAQTISNAAFASTGYTYIVCPDPANITDYLSATIYASDVTVDGQMTFNCTTAPSSNLSVIVLKIQVS